MYEERREKLPTNLITGGAKYVVSRGMKTDTSHWSIMGLPVVEVEEEEEVEEELKRGR